MINNVSLFTPDNSFEPDFVYKSFKYILVDRKSKYTVSWWKVTSKDQVKTFMKELVKEKEFKKATHNTYAWRVQLEDWWIIEWKNDDGETWAWNCVLKELQRKNAVNIIVVATRYYGWVHLHADRFKNVMQVSKIFLEKVVS